MAGDKSKENQELASVQAVKRTGRGGRYNFPNAVEPENPDDVRSVLSECLHWYEVGNAKATTDDEDEQRTFDFFQYCIDTGERPTVEKYALALGYVRQTINAWENGTGASKRRQDIIKKAKETLASFDAGMVSAGKLNPVPYIFRAKNYYGMTDQQQITLTPGQQLSDVPADEIVDKYAALPPDS